MTATIPVFGFEAWAEEKKFPYPREARAFLAVCESPAEAYFARQFLWREEAIYYSKIADSHIASIRGQTVSLGLQIPFAGYRPDAVLTTPRILLAIEIDGAFHDTRRAPDYRKDRLLTRAGATVIRFTATEVMLHPARSWREIDDILVTRRAL